MISLLVPGVIYARGWLALVRRGSPVFRPRQLVAFECGLVVLYLALCSPLDEFAGLLLSAHMVQHLLLMFVAPPLLCYGAPQMTFLSGIPAPVLEYWVMPVLHQKGIKRGIELLTHPVAAWGVAALVLWLWHVPYFYELALSSSRWHYVEHACFFWSSFLFWWPVLQPYPSRAVWPRAAMLPYLFAASLPATVLCAFLSFSDRVLYPRYEAVPSFAGRSPLVDQALAGALMWSVGLVAYLVPLVLIGYELLLRSATNEGSRRRQSQLAADPLRIRPPHHAVTNVVTLSSHYGKTDRSLAVLTADQIAPWRERKDAIEDRRLEPRTYSATVERGTTTAAAGGAPLDLLQAPYLGIVLRSLGTRRIAQSLLFGLALLIMLDGWCGPQFAPLNLAGVLPWVHWRGFVVLTLLLAGNFFCMACPLMLPRAVARRFVKPLLAWPAALRSKWLALALLAVFFWAYEAFDLWSRPAWTAWIMLGYFLTALTIDVLFTGASFCKYVCPIGQFQFVQSLVSPWQVAVRDAQVCASCRTKECIQGSESTRGCEMQLYVPRKASNLDCTFCLDCVRACPVSNIGVLATGADAATSRDVSVAGREERQPLRADVAALLLFMGFAAFANAAGMVAPVVAAEQWIAVRGNLAIWLAETGYLILSLIVLPLTAIGVTAAIARHFAQTGETIAQNVVAYAGALVPLGAAMWLAHYGFHLVVGATALVPASLRFCADWGFSLAVNDWVVKSCCAATPPGWLLRAEILILDLGLLAGLHRAYQIASRRHKAWQPTLAACLPWCLLIGGLFALGLWLLYQPMEMRGAVPEMP